MANQRSSHRRPPLPAEESASRTTHMSLLAATALGLAFASGATDRDVRTLAALAEPDAEVLLQASAAVLALEVAPGQTRARAAELLRGAARAVSERTRFGRTAGVARRRSPDGGVDTVGPRRGSGGT
jgi:hypothetical protein